MGRYSAADLGALIDTLLDAPQVWLMADDMYEHILYDGFSHVTPAAVDARIASRTLTINGVSKAFAMTGWRIGYAGGPADLVKALSVIQSQSTSCPSSVSQAAAVAALEGPQEFLTERCDSFWRRRDLVVARLNAIPGISCRVPEGAFYVFAGCSDLIGSTTPAGDVLKDDREFCAWLLDVAETAVVPGTAFGLSGYFRVSYATSDTALETAMDRITSAVARLERG